MSKRTVFFLSAICVFCLAFAVVPQKKKRKTLYKMAVIMFVIHKMAINIIAIRRNYG